MKVFGLWVGVVTRKQFEARVLELVSDDRILLAITEPMLRVRRALVEEFERLDSLCQQLARRDPVWRWNLAEAASITKKCADHSSSR